MKVHIDSYDFTGLPTSSWCLDVAHLIMSPVVGLEGDCKDGLCSIISFKQKSIGSRWYTSCTHIVSCFDIYIYIHVYTRRDSPYPSFFGNSLCRLGNDGAGHGDLWLWLAACLWWVLFSRLCKQDGSQASKRQECNRSFKLGQQLEI